MAYSVWKEKYFECQSFSCLDYVFDLGLQGRNPLNNSQTQFQFSSMQEPTKKKPNPIKKNSRTAPTQTLTKFRLQNPKPNDATNTTTTFYQSSQLIQDLESIRQAVQAQGARMATALNDLILMSEERKIEGGGFGVTVKKILSGGNFGVGDRKATEKNLRGSQWANAVSVKTCESTFYLDKERRKMTTFHKKNKSLQKLIQQQKSFLDSFCHKLR